MAYNLGVDIGIASIGFAAVDLSENQVLDCGVHIFEAAENPKDGSSLAVPRREKRALRRVIRRRVVRLNAVRNLLEAHGFADVGKIDTPVLEHELSVWDLRKAALDRQLTDAELSRVLFHITKRRGFQSNRKGAEPNDLEGKKALSGAVELRERMEKENALTVGAYLSTLMKKRNGDGSYENFVLRDLLRHEVRKIFEKQRAFSNAKASVALEEAYSDLAFYQRPLQSSEHLIGMCFLEPSEKRAPKFAYTSELFVLWSRLNNTKIRSVGGDERFLTQDEKLRLADKAHSLSKLTYAQARKELALSADERFNIGYRKIKDEDNSWDSIRDTAERADFLRLAGYHELKKALESGAASDWQSWLNTKRNKLDEVAHILSVCEDPKEADDKLAALGLSFDQRKRLISITSFSKVMDLSLCAIRKILPYMQQGMTYDKACEAAGYHHSKIENKGLSLVPVFDDIRNPVVNRALAQARKVINAVIRKRGLPDMIIVELARDVGVPFGDRSPRAIERQNKKNELYRNEARTHMAELLRVGADNLSGEDILKYRLWKEQGGFCPYSGIYITPDMLADPLATQIDHILPYSRSWNDSYMNKVLCLTSENQAKGNDTPVEYFRRKGKSVDSLEVFAAKIPPKKAENLLLENFDNDKAGEWKSRALNDTRYMAKLLKNHLQNNLVLRHGVQTRNGALTANLRRAWGFPDKSRANDRHHAVDAIVLACSTQSMVQQHANFNKYEARRKSSAERVYPPKPWESFRDDALSAVAGVFVSRMPVRKITGAAHEETIRSIRQLPDGGRQIIQRKKLSSLTASDLENMVDKERNIKLYTLLKNRLEAYGGKADKAFAEPVYMPVNNPETPAPLVKSIRVITSEKSGVEINQGLASNGDMVRVDVFKVGNKFHLVPLYVHHFVQESLPNKAIVAFKPEEEWTVVSDADFIFSLYRNDYVVLRSKTEAIEGYYVGTDRSTGGINIRAHDNDHSFGKEGLMRGLGVKTILAFEKYTVDYFGNKHRVGKEQRLGLAHCDDPESCEIES